MSNVPGSLVSSGYSLAPAGWFGSSQNDCGWADDCDFKIRLLPPKKGLQAYISSRYHRIAKQNFQCHRELVNGKWLGDCIACTHYCDFYKNGPPRFYRGDNFEIDVRSIKPVERFYWNIIVREQEEKGPQKWACGRTLQTVIVNAIVGNPLQANISPLGDVTNPKTGCDFWLRRKMVVTPNGNKYPNYDDSRFLTQCPLGTAKQVKQWLANLWDLTECRIIRPEEEMISALEEQFGMLGFPRNKKTFFRSIEEPFIPSW